MDHILRCHPILKEDFVSAQGSFLQDREGRTYLDGESGVWCVPLGHGHPRIQKILNNQYGTLAHMGFRYGCDIIEQAALDLLKVLGFPDGKVVFLTSGSEAVELGLKFAQIVTSRCKWMGLEPSYLSAYGQGQDMGTSRWHMIERSARPVNLPQDPSSYAALVLEPGSAGGSVCFPATELIEPLARDLQCAEALVVVDEVTTGMGRTGQWFAFQHYDLQPDIVAVGKGLGNGYPISAVAVRQHVADHIEAAGLHYVQSHQNDPLGCAVACEVIATLREEGLIQRSAQMGERLQSMLSQRSYPGIREVRGKGLMIAVELTEELQAGNIFNRMLERGILVGCNPSYNCIRFMPPLNTPESALETFVEQCEELLI